MTPDLLPTLFPILYRIDFFETCLTHGCLILTLSLLLCPKNNLVKGKVEMLIPALVDNVMQLCIDFNAGHCWLVSHDPHLQVMWDILVTQGPSFPCEMRGKWPLHTKRWLENIGLTQTAHLWCSFQTIGVMGTALWHSPSPSQLRV